MSKYERLINKYKLYNRAMFHISYYDAEFWEGTNTVSVIKTSMTGKIYFELFYKSGDLFLATGRYMSVNLFVFAWVEIEEAFKMLCGNVHDENCCIRILAKLKKYAMHHVGKKYGLK